MDDTGEWFCYHPLFVTSCASAASGNWRRSCRKSTCRRRKLDGPGISQRSDSSCAAAGDALMLRDILLNHAWSLSTIANCRCWKSRLRPCRGTVAGKSAVGVIAGVADAKPASLGEVNTLLARAEHEIKDIREAPCTQNLTLCAPRWRLTMVTG